MGPLTRFRSVVERLHGTIHLVTGNHDEANPMHRAAHRRQREWMEVFASVQGFARRKVEGRQVLLSHYPYAGEGRRDMADRYTQYRLANEGTALLHGHTHDSDQHLSHHQGTPMVHVGWEAWDRPVGLDEPAELLA